MTYSSKLDVYVLAAIGLGVIVFVMGDYWIAGPVLLVLFLCAYPQSYETRPHGLVIHTALARHVIPYNAIRFIGPRVEVAPAFAVSADRILIDYGPGTAEVLIEPSEREAFLKDIAARTPHLIKRGPRLVAAIA